MKINLKIFAVAIATFITIGSIIFVSCSSEDEKVTDRKRIYELKENDFDMVGRIHNETLWDIGVEFQEDLQRIVEDGAILEDDLIELQARMEEYGRKRCTTLITNSNLGFLEDWRIDMAETVDGFMKDSIFNELLDQTASIEELLKAIKTKEVYIYSDMRTLQDTATLLSLVVLRHSIQFWTEAYYDSEHPWHEMIYNMPFPLHTKGIPDIYNKAKAWVQEKLIPVVKEVVEVVCGVVAFAASDYWMFRSVAPGFTVALGGNVPAGAITAGVMAGVASAIGGAGGYAGSASVLN